MEGGRLLTDLKSRKNWNMLPKSIKCYLQPVFEAPQTLSKSVASKYELFSLKVLHQCVDYLPGSDITSKNQNTLLELADICCSSIHLCPRSSGNISALTYEKLLLQLAGACLQAKAIDRCLSTCDVLQKYLSSYDRNISKKYANEVAGFLKHVYNFMWQAAGQLDRRGSSKESVLEIRRKALDSLLNCGNCDIVSVLEQVVKAEQLFLHPTAPPNALCTCHSFHTSLLPCAKLSRLLVPDLPCLEVAPISRYLLHRAVLARKAGQGAEATELINHALLSLEQHGRSCDSAHHFPVALQAMTVQLWMTITTNPTSESLCDEAVFQLRQLGAEVQGNITKLTDSPGVSQLVLAIEMVTTALKKAGKDCPSPSGYFPPEAFPSLKALVLGGVACLQCTLNPDASRSCRGRVYERQLKLLSFLSRILADLLGAGVGSIEVSRDSSRSFTPSSSESSLKTLLVESCQPLLQQSRDIITKEADLLPVDEHKWLGDDAYVLANSLSEEGLPQHACPMLEISCDEVLVWCQSDSAPMKSLEAKLLERFMTLVRWYTDSGDFSVAMATFDKALKALPIQQLESADTVPKLTENWVRLTRKTEHQACLSGRGLLKSLPLPLPLEWKLRYLEHELSCYQTLRHPPHAPLVTVLMDLISLCNQSSKTLLSAHCAIQLAKVCRHCSPERCEHVSGLTPTELLDEAVQSLECLSSVADRAQLQQALATAYLWRAVITAEKFVSVSKEVSTEGVASDREGEEEEEGSPAKPCDQSAAATAICLFPEEEELMMSEDIAGCLSAAVWAWQEVWLLVKGSASVEFYRPLEMLQHLMLTAVMCSTHSQVQLALKCLSVLLNLCPAGSSPAKHPTCSLLAEHKTETHILRSQALTLFAQLLATEGCVAPIVPALEACVKEEEEEGMGRELVASLHCSLALAEIHLAQLRIEECKTALYHVLDHSSLSGRNTDSLFLCARAKLIACECLLYRTFDLKPSKSLLADRCDSKNTNRGVRPFCLTPVELAVDSVRLLWDLSEHKSVWERSDDTTSGGTRFSCDVLAWNVLLCLLRALHVLGRLQYLHGDVKDALYYAREGAMLAKALYLNGWYQEFLLLLSRAYLLGGLLPSSSLLSSQLARLLKCSQLTNSLLITDAPPTSPSSSTDAPPTSPSLSIDTPSISPSSSSTDASPSSSIDAPPTSPSSSTDALSISTSSQKLDFSTLNALWLRQTVQLVCLACHSAITSAESSHMTDDHMTSIESALAAAKDLLSNLKQCIDLRPIGMPTCIVPPSRPKKIRGRAEVKGHADEGMLKAVSGSGVRMELADVQARYLLATKQPRLARQVLSKALADVGVTDEIRGYEDGTALAWLHHRMGMAMAQELEAMGGREGAWFGVTRGRGADMLHQCVEEFLLSYQLCYPATPTCLLRETCLWLGLLLVQCPDHAHHFQALSQHSTLSHQTVLSLGKKIRKLGVERSAKSAQDHILEVREALANDTPSPQCGPTSSLLLEARQLLLPPSSPPSPSLASHHVSHFPPDWTLLTITLAPKPHPSSPSHILVSKVNHATPTVVAKTRQRGRPSRKRKTSTKQTDTQQNDHMTVLFERLSAETLEGVVKELDVILEEEKKCQSLRVRKEWWTAKTRLDERVQECLDAMQEGFFCGRSELGSFVGPVLLVLGQCLHRLPWESVLDLQDAVVARTPSLSFAAAHRTMVGYEDKDFVDVRSTYFVVNPGGDLKKTEKLFGDWFDGQAGWKGVVGAAPPPDEFSVALQEKDLYVYCGHGVGRFLKDSSLQALHCRASALLMGCSSAQLVVHGQCDPSGALLGYMLAGCPALVGCLWGVTDGEIDRFCQALIKSLLSDNNSALSLSEHVNVARSACKLVHLVGAAPVVYGLPLKPKL